MAFDVDECPRVVASIFKHSIRRIALQDKFNVVMIVPTGIGSHIGGHAGDATPAARILAQSCDTLITHPNVVNASDINELPDNGLYVEGSVLSRFLMGAIGLQQVRCNRVLVIVEAHDTEIFVNDAVNMVNGARATYGLNCPEIIILDDPYLMKAWYTEAGSAAGRVENLGPLLKELDARVGDFDAVALTSLIDVPPYTQKEYFQSRDERVNPWGGVEAMLTHAITSMYNVPAAHAPMMEGLDIALMNLGFVDPRMAAEAVSMTFFNCVLKGLHRSPRIVTDQADMGEQGVLSAKDVSVLVQPDGCIGLPTLAALEQGITVIAVEENQNIMRNQLDNLPWKQGQFYRVANYMEAGGLLLALKAGISPASVRRPLDSVVITDQRKERLEEENVDEGRKEGRKETMKAGSPGEWSAGLGQ